MREKAGDRLMEPNMDDVTVGLCGLGSIGKAAARLLLEHRSGVRVVSAITKVASDRGKPLGEVVGSTVSSDVVVGDDLEAVLETRPDIVLLATGSFLDETAPDILSLLGAGINVISPCEELAYPFTRDEAVASKVDEAGRSGGATALGTGVNPGFIFDGFLSAATGCAWDVRRLHGRRIVDVAGFGESIHRRLGVGYTPEEFDRGHDDGTIAGHVGFPESAQLVAERLGWQLDGPVREEFVPMVATTPAPTTYGELAPGLTEGFVQRAIGTVDGEPVVEIELVLHLRPQEQGMVPSDSFSVEGSHPVSVTIEPGMDAIPATSAQLVNCMPAVLDADPGLKTINDLPAAAAWTDLRRRVKR